MSRTEKTCPKVNARRDILQLQTEQRSRYYGDSIKPLISLINARYLFPVPRMVSLIEQENVVAKGY